MSKNIIIKNAYANNLKNVSLEIPKKWNKQTKQRKTAENYWKLWIDHNDQNLTLQLFNIHRKLIKEMQF